jgi:hypothetical protein
MATRRNQRAIRYKSAWNGFYARSVTAEVEASSPFGVARFKKAPIIIGAFVLVLHLT